MGKKKTIKTENKNLNLTSLLKIRTKEYTTSDKYNNSNERTVYEFTFPISSIFNYFLQHHAKVDTHI
ncbi:hypothetical protein ABH942_003242 [Flavobacterium sp. 28YEA47A]